MTDFARPSDAPRALPDMGRLLEFARSEVFERTFREGMALVEETAAYLDGPGRALSKRMERAAALAYAGESMRLTTRLMQVASWLLVQRALRDGDMTLADAADAKYRLSARVGLEAPALSALEELPAALRDLMERGAGLYDRVRRLDAEMYETSAAANPVTAQIAQLKAAFGG